MNEPQKVVLFSGGRTSGFMVRKLMDMFPDYREQFITIFCNTGKERSETLEFVRDVEIEWEVPIVWLEYDRTLASNIPIGIFPTERRNQNHAKAIEKGEETHWFRQVDFCSASANGAPFDRLLNWMGPLPNVVSRGCSMQLKIRTAMRYLFSIGLKEYRSIIGIRKDEEHRATQILSNCDSFEHPEFPLIKYGITEQHVMNFWRNNKFDLRLKSYEGNCDLCFLKAKWKRILLIQENPGMVNWWKDWEERKSQQGVGNGVQFRLGEPYSELERIASNAKDQSEFCFIKSTEQDIPCSCAEKAFEPEESD